MANRGKKSNTKETQRKKTVRVAMIGAGGRATSAHYPALKALEGVEMVAVSELSDQRMADAAERFGIQRQYSDYRKMIEKEKPDAVYAIMPPHHLYDISATVMEMGCHLFIEKPPAMTTEQTRQMALLARKHKVLTGVTFQRRFAPLIRYGKELCEKRGAVHSAVATFYKNAVGGAPYYRGAIDILTSDAIHAVDTLRYLCGGEVESVASDVRREAATHTNIYLALVRFSSGATGVLLTNWMTGRRIFSVEIHSPGISVFGDPEEGGRVYADNKDEPIEVLDPFRLGGGDEAWRAFGAYDTHRHFIDCIRDGKQPETCLEDAVKTMDLVDRIYQSQI